MYLSPEIRISEDKNHNTEEFNLPFLSWRESVYVYCIHTVPVTLLNNYSKSCSSLSPSQERQTSCGTKRQQKRVQRKRDKRDVTALAWQEGAV